MKSNVSRWESLPYSFHHFRLDAATWGCNRFSADIPIVSTLLWPCLIPRTTINSPTIQFIVGSTLILSVKPLNLWKLTLYFLGVLKLQTPMTLPVFPCHPVPGSLTLPGCLATKCTRCSTSGITGFKGETRGTNRDNLECEKGWYIHHDNPQWYQELV